MIISLMQIVKYIINVNLSCLGFYCSQNLNYLAFQSFDFERTSWSLFQKRVVRNTFDIYVFITITGSPKVSSASNQWFGNDMVSYYIYYWNLQFLNNIIINKTKVLLLQAQVTLADFGYFVYALWFYCSQSVTLFDFAIFQFWSYLKVIPETRRVH